VGRPHCLYLSLPCTSRHFSLLPRPRKNGETFLISYVSDGNRLLSTTRIVNTNKECVTQLEALHTAGFCAAHLTGLAQLKDFSLIWFVMLVDVVLADGKK
jgi:hypothetical protein